MPSREAQLVMILAGWLVIGALRVVKLVVVLILLMGAIRWVS